MATVTALLPPNTLPPSEPPAFNEPLDQDSDLPSYNPRAPHVSRPVEDREFEYKVEKSKGQTLASLKILAPAAYSKNIPTFCGTGPVKGSANLFLDAPDAITSVVVTIRGRFSPGRSRTDFQEELVLFDISNTLWAKDADAGGTAGSHSHTPKLSGTHSWPFSVSIPDKIEATVDGATDTGSATGATTAHDTPQTFNERTLSASIQYEVILHIGRGRFKSDYKISCPFGYIPIIRPPPFPALKAISYQEGTPLPDPEIDVDGWIPAKKVHVSGTLFKSHPVAVECQLFLSAPLAYTRGSVIPLYMRMESSDQQALDLLATHNAVIVRLQRRIHYAIPATSLKNPNNYHRGKDERDFVEAVWWPAVNSSQENETPTTSGAGTHTVCLNGEIHLRADLVPSTTLPGFTVEYEVCLRPFNATGFHMAEAKEGASLVEHPVSIATAFAAGPRSVRYAPPGYNSERPIKMEFGLALGTLGDAFI